ncbi:peptidoglycan-binding protein [Pendulispora rubella]|uniref:Peptidoglycan-binding protein n=1 Tax=Pendulispora rubella TaxID=2741070 RepID=A0ABZ2LDJ6_9BACT
MPKNHTVKLGDCMASLAQENGFSDYRAIYDDPGNTSLKSARPNPNILAEGDAVVIPDVASKSASAATGKVHTITITVVEAMFRIFIKDHTGVGIAGLAYEVEVGAVTFSGSTAADGKIECQISAVQRTGTLRLWKNKAAGIDGYSFPLEFGALEHESVDRACQERLLHLGFDCGGTSGTIDARTKEALRAFQKRAGLTESGNLEAGTRSKLRSENEGL